MAFLLTFSGGASATYKDAVRVARDTQLALTGSHPLTVDGIPLVDQDRVLLRGQTNQAENGIYVYSVSGGTYTLSRSLDANNSNELLPNMLVPVSDGSANADKIFQLVSPNVAPINLDVDNLVFTDVLIGLANKADRDLANLLPTSINQSLLFADDTSYNIGAAAASRPQTLYVKTAINLASLTASEILASDASKNVVSSGVATTDMSTSVSDTQAATALSTPSVLVKRDANGESAFDGVSIDGATSGAIKLQAADTTSSYSVKLPAAQGAANAFLENDGSGNLSWTLIPDPLPAYSDDKVLYSTASAAEWRTVGTGSTSAAYPADTVIVGRTKPTGLTGTPTIIIGTGTAGQALTSGPQNVIIGHNAGPLISSVSTNTIIGAFAGSSVVARGNTIVGNLCNAVGEYNAVVGFNSSCSGGVERGIAIGLQTSVTGTRGIAIGENATATTSSIAIGAGSLSLSNTIAVGSASHQINTMYFGRGGASQTVANAVKIMTMRSSGTDTDMSVGTLTIAAAQGTGTGAGGDVIIATAPPAVSSGSSLNAHVERMRVTDDGDVGIGLSSPVAQLHVANQVQIGGAINAIPGNPGSMAFVSSDPSNNNTFRGVYFGNITDGCTMDLRKSRGTEASPLPVNSGDRLGRVSFRGNADTTAGGTFSNSAYMQCIAEETFSPTARGSRLEFRTTTAGTTSLVERMRIQTGSIVLNETGADYDFRVEGDTDQNLINVDASNDAVGIGISGAVTEKLEVNGNVLVANHAVITQTLRARDGVGSAQHDILLRGGDGLTGNHDGGDVTIQGGLKHGTGADGEIIFKVLGAEAAKISASNNLDLSCGLIVNSAHAQAGTADVITVADDDFYVGVDCSLAAKTVNLPTAVAGKKLVIKDESGDASTNNITVSGTIDGAANYVMAVDYEALTLVSDGTNWFII